MKTLFGKIVDYMVLTVTILYDMFTAFLCGAYSIALMCGSLYVSSDHTEKMIWFVIMAIMTNGIQFLIRMWLRTYKK